jgi:hypothetical protein
MFVGMKRGCDRCEIVSREWQTLLEGEVIIANSDNR